MIYRVRLILSFMMISLMVSSLAQADCTTKYKEKVRHLGNTAAFSGLASIFVATIPITVPIAAWKGAAASATSDGLDLILEAKEGQGGEQTKRLYEYALKKKFASTPKDLDSISALIKQANERDLFCGTEEVFTFKEILKVTKNGCLKKALAFPTATYAHLRTCMNEPSHWMSAQADPSPSAEPASPIPTTVLIQPLEPAR